MQTTDLERLKFLRIEVLKLSQSELAKEIEFKQSSYSEVERGVNKISKRLTLSIKEKFSVNPDWIYTGEGEMFISEKPKADLSERLKDELKVLKGVLIGKGWYSEIADYFPKYKVSI
jgi:DNA-binding XRE family transcriptional regulator